MFDNWLHPIEKKEVTASRLANYSFGKAIKRFDRVLPDLRDVKVALIGIEEKEANAIRSYLYPMSYPFKDLKVADLGNVRRQDIAFITPLLREMMEGGIFPVLIGGDVSFTLAQYQSFISVRQHTSVCLVDEKIRYNKDSGDHKAYFLNDMLSHRRTRLFHLSVLGTQSHFIAPKVYTYLEKRNFECFRLGKAKADLAELEPVVRDADVFSFNLAALKQSEAPGHPTPSPSGFTSEEACQICRYAGMSDKLKSFGIFGFKKSMDRKGQTAHTIAQMVWYFLEGYYHRKSDFPVSTDGLVEYIVDFKGQDYSLVFWKSAKSGRWWMQIPVKTSKKYQRHHLVPCSFNDYKLACQEELPERLLTALKRFA